MRFKIVLERISGNMLPINYQYPLNAWIYKTLSGGDQNFATWLHSGGYQFEGKEYKLFSFSRLMTKLKRVDDRFELSENQVSLIISFLPLQALDNFIKGAFKQTEFTIGDKISRVTFRFVNLQVLPNPDFKEVMSFNTLSPIHIRTQDGVGGRVRFLSPDDADFERVFAENLIRKHQSLSLANNQTPVEYSADDVKLKITSTPQSRLVTIKEHTPHQTKIKAFDFAFTLQAPVALMEVGYFAGFGSQNSNGFGLVEEK